MKNTLRLIQSRWTMLSIRHTAFAYVAILLVIVGFRRFIIDSNDPYKCKALMNDGQWYHGRTWLTPGCVTEPYGSRATVNCLANRRVVFAGDSQIEALYWAMVQKLDHDIKPEFSSNRNLQFSKNDVKVQFLWDLYLNGSDLYQVADAYHEGGPDAPALMVMGPSNSYAERKTSADVMATVESVASAALRGASEHGAEMLLSEDGTPGDLFLFAPVQEPYRDVSATHPQLPSEWINDHLKVLADQNAINLLRSFNKMTAGHKDKYLDDGWNVRWSVLQQRIDLLLSLRCNAKTAQAGQFPNIKTCCSNWSAPTWFQSGFLVFGFGLFPATVFADHLHPFLSMHHRTVLRALCAFSATISLQYIADRTHVFEQVQRLHLELPNLMSMIVFALLIGLITVRRNTPPKVSNRGGKESSQPFLSRDQSDEWKGWMQLLIIFYHYNMAWTADWFWEIIRLVVASYLFLTGFGHTVYFLQKGDFSFRRVCAVMIRTNLLPCTLAYVMRTRWLLYYYMPLSSFWFLVVYATMAIVSKHNNIKIFVLAKIVASAAAVHTFISTRDLPETVVRFFAITCKMSFDAGEFFHHRVQIDQYVVYVGMLVALIYVWSRDALDLDEPATFTTRYFRFLFPWLKHTAIGLGLVGFPGFFYIVHQHIHSQSDWTAWQPYITFIPILAFLVLRNAHLSLRNFHSVAFAWLGRYSGEMYVMQDHLWLAGDQEAVLRTGLFHGDETLLRDRWRDLLLITPLYLIACSIIGDATSTITTFFTQPPAPPESSRVGDLTPVNEVELRLMSNMDIDNDNLVSEKHLSRQDIWKKINWSPWPNQIRNRAILILFLMWALNVVSYVPF